MATPDMKGIRIAILATDGFEWSELILPREAFDRAGAETRIISLRPGKIRGWQEKDWKDELAVDETVDHAHADAFNALLLPGGVMNPDTLRMSPEAVDFVRDFFEAEKPVAAICHGPVMIIEAGEAFGRRLTSWPSLKTDLRNAGAEWVDTECITDGNLVTSRKPGDIPAFNEKAMELFCKFFRKSSVAA